MGLLQENYRVPPFLKGEQKCFLCDSRYPYNPYTHPNSHPIENVLTTFEPDRKKKWWQSENGIDHVSIRLDLETLFQFSHLILTFKTFRPAAMLVERSTDYGHTWKIFRYFAQNCAESFPNIPSGPAKGVGDIVCDPRYSDVEPSTEGEVVLKALDPSFEIENPYIRSIQACKCNGHSDRCHFDMAVYIANDRISGGVCEDCQHHTMGQHCDQCKPFFYQDPLRTISDPRACIQAAPGYFFLPLDYYIYEAEHAKPLPRSAPLGWVQSGRNSALDIVFREPTPGKPVTWTGPGFARVLNGAGLRFTISNIPFAMDFDIALRYEPELGLIPRISSAENLCSQKDLDEYQQYHCVEIASEVGPHILPEVCARLTVSMSARIHNGAVRCTCNFSGVNPAICPPGNGVCLCNRMTGVCPCLPNVIGSTCDQCASGYWNMSNGIGCQFCDCNPRNSQSNQCNQFTGQCPCKLGYSGRRCDECEENYFGDPRMYCISCTCNQEGTRKPKCDKETGACNCRIGVTGKLCDQCGRGFKQEFPICSRCHLCFDQWDNEITTLSQTVQGFMRFAANLEDKRDTMPSCDMRFKGLEDKISEIERILKTPVLSLETFLNIKDFHDYIRQKVAQMDLYLNKMDEFPNLNGIIHDIRKEADQLYESLKQKIHLYHSLNNLSHKDSFSNIRKYYQMSSFAVEKISGAIPIIRYSENTRDGILAMLGNRTSKENYTLEQLRLFKIPDIQKLNEKIESIRKMAEETKTKGSRLHRKLEKAKNQTEIDREDAKEFIRKVKDFLLDESAPPEDIEKVAKHVLVINLPRTPQELTNMLDKIQNLVTHCENYEINVNKLNKQRKDAQKLLVEAKQAEEAAKALPPLDEMINNLKEAESTKGQTKDTFIRLNGEIQEIKTKISQAENQVNKTSDELKDFSDKQSELEDEITMLQKKMLTNGNQAANAKADAEQAQNQAMDTDKEFTNLERKYTILQEKVKMKGLPRETLEKLKQLKEAAEKLAEETEENIKRITDLAKKLQDLNQTKQDKADQLKQLEDQVIAIKKDITEQENKYATCKS
ncbi:unnamed protein product [Caretta caretta]